MDPNLVSYIERHLAKGVSHDRIREILLQAGHSEQNISAAFQHIVVTKPHLFKKSYFWIIGIILLVAAAGSVVYFSGLTQQIELPKLSVDYSGMSDQDLLVAAQQSNTTEPCAFIDDIYRQGLCSRSIWVSRPCYFKRLIGDNSPC